MDLKSRLQGQFPLIGSWINTVSPVVAEVMALAGFDFLTVDAEHSAVDFGTAQILFQAIRSGNPQCAPMIRLCCNDYAQTKKFMDIGAAGVIAPLINSAEEARLVVDSVKFPPQGRRGVGFCRANGYGLYLEKEMNRNNEQALVCLQIEHIDGLSRLEEILSVKGVDVAFIGPYDLSASMGITGQFDHPDMVNARKIVLESCKRHGIIPGIHVVQPDTNETIKRIAEGYKLIAYSLDITMLLRSSIQGLETIKDTFR